MQVREAFKKLTNSHPLVLEPLDMVTEEYNLKNHTVQICDLSTDEIAKNNNWIGANQVSQCITYVNQLPLKNILTCIELQILICAQLNFVAGINYHPTRVVMGLSTLDRAEYLLGTPMYKLCIGIAILFNN